MSIKKKTRIDFNFKVLSTIIFAVIFATLLLWLAYKVTSDGQYYLTYILCISGCILGWLIGIVTTPYDDDDAKKIGNFSKMIGTFLSGYLLSKFDGIISKMLNPDTFFSSTFGLRFLLFVSFFVISWIVVFVFRLYTNVEE